MDFIHPIGIEQADPYYSPLLDFMSRGNYYSEKVTNIPEGLLLPVGIGPLGIEPTRRSPFMDQYYQGWITGKNVERRRNVLGTKSNSAYTVVNLSMQFYRTWDEDFTRKVYPYVKGVAHFWEHYLVKEGERYVIYNDAVHEGTVGTKNGVASLGLVRNAMQTAIDMSTLLGVDADRRATWKDVMDHLSDYPTQTRNGKVVFRYSEKGPDWWGIIRLVSSISIRQDKSDSAVILHCWKLPGIRCWKWDVGRILTEQIVSSLRPYVSD